jgi:hypothetical protein
MAVPPVEQPLAFANVESLVVAFLGGRAELNGVQVLLRLPDDYDGRSRAVVVFRVGGEFASDDYLDRAIIRIDTFAGDKGGALDLAGTVRSLIWLMPGVGHANGVAIADVVEDRGPSWLRDPVHAGANRYTTRYRLLVRVSPMST